MKIPCHNCICVAACKHKAYRPMITDCALIRKILYTDFGLTPGNRSDNYSEIAKEIINYMNPSWTLIPTEKGDYVIHNHDIKWMAKRRKV